MASRRATETKVHGQHACRALFARRPGDILRVYLLADLVKPFGDLLAACAAARKAYKIVPADELDAVTESTHHEGICVVASPRAEARPEALLVGSEPAVLVALADVGNPHNVGAIVRTAAHFGARAVLLGGLESVRLPPAVYRTSQGGVEFVDFAAAPDLGAALAACRRAGFTICASSSHEGRDLFNSSLPKRAVVLLGSEGEGLPKALMEKADLLLKIPGTGNVESLNVAAAAAVLLAELYRQNA